MKQFTRRTVLRCSGMAAASLALQSKIIAWTQSALSAPLATTTAGKVSGFIGVLAWHETYHVGQIAYLRSWLGLSGVFG